MRVFVANGSGVIGWQLVPMLVAEGHEVVASAPSLPGRARSAPWVPRR
jgi:nucleoside-diphosphate-sugar epimerase